MHFWRFLVLNGLVPNAPVGSPDPVDIYQLNPARARPLGRAAMLAILLHLLLFLLVRFEVTPAVFPDDPVFEVTDWQPPAAAAASAAGQRAVQAVTTIESRHPRPVPMPQIRQPQAITRSKPTLPHLQTTASGDLGIGDIAAPPGNDSASGKQSASRTPDGTDPIWPQGSGGVIAPVLLHHTTPTYTDAAIKARAEGVVLLSAVIRSDGSISDVRVLRALGYGLDEAAIAEITRHWKFLPGRRGDVPVNVRATIEVSFSLR